jgi:hypothetical protein
MKLDLKNSKWWNLGFNADVLQDHLNKILAEKKETLDSNMHQIAGDTFLHQLPLEVRAAQEKLGLDQTSMLQDLKMQSEMKESNFVDRFKQPSDMQIRGMEEQMEGNMISPIGPDYDFGQSPQFVDVDQPLDMLHVLDRMGDKDFSR